MTSLNGTTLTEFLFPFADAEFVFAASNRRPKFPDGPHSLGNSGYVFNLTGGGGLFLGHPLQNLRGSQHMWMVTFHLQHGHENFDRNMLVVYIDAKIMLVSKLTLVILMNISIKKNCNEEQNIKTYMVWFYLSIQE